MSEAAKQLTPTDAETGAVNMIEVIAKAASDPQCDTDKMQALLDMQERILDKQAEHEFWTAFAEMQPNLPAITERGEIKDKNGKVVSKYARYDEDIKPVITPILSEYGFTLMHQSVGTSTTEVVIKTTLAHRAGHKESATFHLKADGSGYKNETQGMGSARSYGKRYNTCDLLDIATGGQDDDGSKAGVKTITDKQIADLNAKIDEAQDKDKLLAKIKKNYSVDNIGQIPQDKFKEVIARCNDFIKAGG